MMNNEQCKNCPLIKEIAKLRAEIEELKKNQKNSSNSSMPPSLDNKKYPRREKSKLSPGGQFGHKGYTRTLVDNPDAVIEVYPKACECCGNDQFVKNNNILERRQLIDIPPIVTHITEYQQKAGICNKCGRRNLGIFPINSKVQFGNRIKAFIGYFHVMNHLSYVRLKQTFNDIFSINISKGTIDNKIKELENKLTPAYFDILENLKNSNVIGSDETGMRIKSTNSYIWTFQNEMNTFFKNADSRGFKVIEETIGNEFQGSWVSDRLGSQLKIKADHQLCLPHLIRDCKYIEEIEKSKWAKRLRKFFEKSIKFKKEKEGNFKPLEANTFREIQKLKKELYRLFSKAPPQKQEKTLYNQLIGRQNQLILFLEKPEVPHDNNGSERALRNRVVHRKVAGCFRSNQGADSQDVIASVIETAKKRGLNIFDTLYMLCSENQFLLST